MTEETITSTSLEARLESELRGDLIAAASSSGCDILEAELKGGRLQIVLDHAEGVTLAHCEEVAKKISAVLDAMDFGDTKYLLEVSSPGLDRKLYGVSDFERFTGRSARVTWVDPQAGKRTDVGRIEELTGDAAAPDGIRLALQGDASLEVPLAAISEARLEIEI